MTAIVGWIYELGMPIAIPVMYVDDVSEYDEPVIVQVIRPLRADEGGIGYLDEIKQYKERLRVICQRGGQERDAYNSGFAAGIEAAALHVPSWMLKRCACGFKFDDPKHSYEGNWRAHIRSLTPVPEVKPEGQ